MCNTQFCQAPQTKLWVFCVTSETNPKFLASQLPEVVL